MADSGRPIVSAVPVNSERIWTDSSCIGKLISLAFHANLERPKRSPLSKAYIISLAKYNDNWALKGPAEMGSRA